MCLPAFRHKATVLNVAAPYRSIVVLQNMMLNVQQFFENRTLGTELFIEIKPVFALLQKKKKKKKIEEEEEEKNLFIMFI